MEGISTAASRRKEGRWKREREKKGETGSGEKGERFILFLKDPKIIFRGGVIL